MSADRSRSRAPGLRRGACFAAFALLSGCDWFTDFKDQPKMEPWESAYDSVPPRGNPQTSVPLEGSLVPGFVVSRAALPGTIDSMANLVNPIPADARSLDNGRKLYQINCAVCHGANGSGVGPTVRYGMPGISLTGGPAPARSDGYIWGMIRNGRGLMPPYNRIEELERWDVVNYVRGLQGRYAVDTSMARPGITGAALPAASIVAPTRPAPYFNPLRPAAGPGTASSPAAAADTAAGSPADTSAGARGRQP